MRKLLCTWVVGVVVVGLPSSSLGDWPVARHDPQRTAFVPGTSNITKPGLAWRYYLGGALTGNQYWAGDVNGSGVSSIVYTAGGKVIVKHSDDTVVWETPPLALSEIVDVWDVDGDGTLDVVAAGIPSVVDIFSGKDGTLEWSLPAAANIQSEDIAYAPSTRTADLDGDGKRDLYVTSFSCAGGGPCNDAVAYSFAGGFAAAEQLWAIPMGTSTNNDGAGGGQDVIADINGDGILDVIRVDLLDQAVQAFSGKTGALEWSSADTVDGGNYGSLTWECSFDAVPSVGGAGQVVIYYESLYAAAAPTYGGHRVMAFGYSGGSIVELWEKDAGPAAANEQVAYDASSIGKFDSSGSWEVAFSLYDGTAWTLMVVDAASGNTVASLPGAMYVGAAVTQSGKPTSIIASVSGVPTVFTVSGSALAAGVTLPGGVTTHLDRVHAERSSIATPIVSTNIGGHPELILYTGSTYEAVDASSAATVGTPVASFTAGSGLTLLTTEVYTDPSTMLPEPYLALSSGFLVVLSPENFQPLNMQGGEFPVPGMVIGGYYSGARDVGQTPVVGSFAGDGGTPSVVVQDSQGNLLRLDPGKSASVVQPPNPVWTLAGGSSPSLVDLDGDGVPEVVEVSGATVFAYKADGKTVVWQSSTSPDAVLYGLPFGDANGDGTPDIFYSAITPASAMTYNVLDGTSGTALWMSPFTQPIYVGRSPLAVGDVNGDGMADAVTGVNYPTYLSGPTGNILATNPNDLAAFGCPEPMIANVLGGSTPQVFFGGFYAPQLDNADAGTIWSEDAGATPLDGGAQRFWTEEFAGLAPCNDGGSLFLEGEYLSPTLYAYDSATGNQVWAVSLASGKAFTSGVPAGTLGGFLGNVTIKQDLTGTGHVEALVGSTDGYLYALQACSGALDWSYNFGFPVGEPVVADSTGTGTDQVIVSVADGYLYAINHEAIAPPAYVHAVDPPEGFPHTAVSTIRTTSTLYAEWASVPGATSYQWAIFTSAGSILGTNGYQTTTATTGTVVDLTAGSLALVNNGEYFFAVRAVGALGASSDTISNTVKVTYGQPTMDGGTPAFPDAGKQGGADASGDASTSGEGSSSGCGCSQVKSPVGVPAVALFIAPLVLLSRRARRPRRVS